MDNKFSPDFSGGSQDKKNSHRKFIHLDRNDALDRLSENPEQFPRMHKAIKLIIFLQEKAVDLMKYELKNNFHKLKNGNIIENVTFFYGEELSNLKNYTGSNDTVYIKDVKTRLENSPMPLPPTFEELIVGLRKVLEKDHTVFVLEQGYLFDEVNFSLDDELISAEGKIFIPPQDGRNAFLDDLEDNFVFFNLFYDEINKKFWLEIENESEFYWDSRRKQFVQRDDDDAVEI